MKPEEELTTKENCLKTVKPGDFNKSLKIRIEEGDKIKGTLNTKKIYLSKLKILKITVV